MNEDRIYSTSHTLENKSATGHLIVKIKYHGKKHGLVLFV